MFNFLVSGCFKNCDKSRGKCKAKARNKQFKYYDIVLLFGARIIWRSFLTVGQRLRRPHHQVLHQPTVTQYFLLLKIFQDARNIAAEINRMIEEVGTEFLPVMKASRALIEEKYSHISTSIIEVAGNVGSTYVNKIMQEMFENVADMFSMIENRQRLVFLGT
jgi:hypothetical protein